MIFAALSEAAERNELLLVDGGLCRWHQRKDGVIVIRELLVLPALRKSGIGRDLIQRLKLRNRPLIARCPQEYPSNRFWQRMGFTLEQPGKVNVWRWSPDSSIAPMATPPLPG